MTPKKKGPPGNVSHLQKLVASYAEAQEMPPARLQRWLNAMVVTAALDRVRDEDGEPIFLLMGGVAIELRLKLRARATKDFDAAFRATTKEVMDLLDEALAEPYGPFTVRRDEPETIAKTKAIRVRLRLDFRGRQWSSVYVEMAQVEGGMGKEVERVPATPLDPP